MRCPRCKSEQVIVVDTRKRWGTVWRRRECYNCKNRFNTYEMDEETYEAFMRVRDIIPGKDKEEYY